MISLIEKEIYAERKYITSKYCNKKLKALYWFLKYRYYKNKNEKEFYK